MKHKVRVGPNVMSLGTSAGNSGNSVLRRDFDRPNTFAVRFSLVQFGSLWFNMASVDIINVENKYDYPDNYELQQHRRSSVAVEWYKKCITTASSTVLLGITRAFTHGISLAP